MDKSLDFNYEIQVPEERIPILIGSAGSVKNEISNRCDVKINIQSDTGRLLITSNSNNNDDFFKALEIVRAISHGFSPDNALRLLDDDNSLEIIDFRDFIGKSPKSILRMKGRVIGESGKTRKTIQELTGCLMSVYHHTVSIIGSYNEIKIAHDAIMLLLKGKSHRSVYDMLYLAKRKSKIEKLQLWED